MTASLERAGVRKRDAHAQFAVRLRVRALVTEVRHVGLAGPFECTGQRERRGRVIRRAARPRVDDGPGHPVGDLHERHDVSGVVPQDGLDERGVGRREITEVALRNERARDIVLACDVQDGILELPQRRRAEAAAPESACRMEQIEMRIIDVEIRPQGHDEPSP